MLNTNVGLIRAARCDNATAALMFCCCFFLFFLFFIQREISAVSRRIAAKLCHMIVNGCIHYKFKCSQASKARLQSSKHTGAKQSAKWPFKVIQGHVFWSQLKGDKGLSNTKY